MSVTVRDVMEKMEQWCPSSLACSWDNSGLQVGSKNQTVTHILVALDVTRVVVEEAASLGAEMIITHHPLIFGGLQNLSLDDYPQAVVAALLQADITHFAAHTNLDIAAGGVNDTLAVVLGLEEVRSFAAEGDMDGLGRIGTLSRGMSFARLELLIKEKLGLDYLKVVPTEKEIRSVAVCGGSGMDLLVAAKKAGADCLISAEGKHHQALMAQQLGIGLMDAGHFHTERVVVPVIARYLQEHFPELTVSCSKQEKSGWLVR